jgi:geranylgeranyl diphosphate synthase type I
VIPTRNTPEVLDRARELVVPALRAAIDRLSPDLRPIAEYHLGWSDATGRPSGGNGGKGVRPALAVLSAEAVGADAAFGVPGGVAVELVHNFSLIHDDVIDEDVERRHRTTVWAQFGIGPAVIVGDALLALALQVVLDACEQNSQRGAPGSTNNSGRATACIVDATAAMIAGQALDMAFESVPSVDIEGCLAMEAGKTGALLGCAASIGAVIAGADGHDVVALDRFGVELGMAFQAVDDLLGIWGDPAMTGKSAWSDLRQHKKTLPVAAALATGSGAAEELAALMSLAQLSDDEVARAATLVEQCGGREVTTSEARFHLDNAVASLNASGLKERARDELIEVAHFVVDRES